MKAFKALLAAIGIPALAVAIFFISRWYQDEFKNIPDKRMWIDGRDFKNGALVIGPQKGTATIFCSKFTIAFEGVSSWSYTSLIKSQYKVDGRYGGINSSDSPVKEDMGNGVSYEYSPRQREATITFKNHRFVYCDYLNTLKADGVEYSTDQAPVRLWVSKQGQIKQLD